MFFFFCVFLLLFSRLPYWRRPAAAAVVEADAGPSATNLHPPATPVTEGHYARILKKDKLVQKLSDLINSGSMGRALTKDEIALATSKFADRFKQRVGNPIYDQPAAVDTGQQFDPSEYERPFRDCGHGLFS